VALKVLHPKLAAAAGPERFLREIRLAACLQPVSHLWFTMPYVDGESLRDRLAREKQLPVGEAVRIVREATEALDYAHQHGVIHRVI
jgi:eukaryotic-like serine/threonine-protein kinase